MILQDGLWEENDEYLNRKPQPKKSINTPVHVLSSLDDMSC